MENKFDELLQELNKYEIIQTTFDWEEIIPEELWNEHFENNNHRVVAWISYEKHRHYETGIIVISIYGRYLGIRALSDIYSEMTAPEDCYHIVKFYEMESKTKKTFKIKE